MYKPYINILLCLIFVSCNDSIKYSDGGYDYPKHIADKYTNFYYYPVKDVMPKRDSVFYAVTYLALKEYNEPNLSLRSQKQDVFRLQYSAALGFFYIITLTKNSIQIKKEIGDTSSFDLNRLAPFEQKIYNTFLNNYPFDKLKNYRKFFIDSLKLANPNFVQPQYYIYLTNKAYKHLQPELLYTLTTIKIKPEDYQHLVKSINNSGYWKMPYDFDCKNASMDGYGYMLEANTKYKYNLVNATSCDYSSEQQIKFSKACQEIINYAHLNKEIFLWSAESDTAKELVVHDVQLEDIKDSKTIKKSRSKNKKYKGVTQR